MPYECAGGQQQQMNAALDSVQSQIAEFKLAEHSGSDQQQACQQWPEQSISKFGSILRQCLPGPDPFPGNAQRDEIGQQDKQRQQQSRQWRNGRKLWRATTIVGDVRSTSGHGATAKDCSRTNIVRLQAQLIRDRDEFLSDR